MSRSVRAASEAAQPRQQIVPERTETPALSNRRDVALVLLAIVLALLCAGSAYLFSSRQETVYGARTEILYQASDAERTLGTARVMATQKVVLTSRTVLQPAATAVGLPLEDVKEATSVKIEGESDVMQVTVSDPDRALALSLAKRITDDYADNVAKASAARIGEGKQLLETRIAQLTRRLTRVGSRLRSIERARAGSTLPPSSEQQQLQAESEALLQRIGALHDRLTELDVQQIAQGQAEVRIITPAHLLEDPLEPKPIRAAVAGLFLGLILAAGLVVLASHRRRRTLA
jgi:uncharacterized protein involved in exopolysaccharide biosynthesis